jgi:hypothetical protein
MEWFTAVAGYKWCSMIRGDQVVQTPAGEKHISITAVYSMNEPRIELVKTVPGTIWTPTSGSVHHLGYWSDDVDADIAKLLANGLEIEVKSNNPDGTALWAYCGKVPAGPRIELVSKQLKARMTEMFTTGSIGALRGLVDVPQEA